MLVNTCMVLQGVSGSLLQQLLQVHHITPRDLECLSSLAHALHTACLTDSECVPGVSLILDDASVRNNHANMKEAT